MANYEGGAPSYGRLSDRRRQLARQKIRQKTAPK